MQVALLFLIFVTGAAAQYGSGVFGLDVSSGISGTISQSNWQCMNQNGNYTFAIVEGWQGGYGQNTNLASAIAGAWAGGFKAVDVYSFMCPRCSNNGVSAVQSLVNYLSTNSVQYGTIWVDVEQCTGCWYATLSSNCQWILSIVQAYQNLSVNVGLYTSPYEWGATVGSCTDSSLASLPLWYANYDGQPNFNDWSNIGPWTQPYMKQFADSAGNSCGISIDRNWAPQLPS